MHKRIFLTIAVSFVFGARANDSVCEAHLKRELRMATRVISLSVGKPKILHSDLGDVRTSMDKTPIEGPLRVSKNRVVGNKQGSTVNTLYVLGLKQIMPYMRAVGYHRYPRGFLGENILVKDLNEWTAYRGDRWRIGDVELYAMGSRSPCFKLERRFNQKDAATKMKLLRCGGIMFEPENSGEIHIGDRMERFQIGFENMPIIPAPRR